MDKSHFRAGNEAGPCLSFACAQDDGRNSSRALRDVRCAPPLLRGDTECGLNGGSLDLFLLARLQANSDDADFPVESVCEEKRQQC